MIIAAGASATASATAQHNKRSNRNNSNNNNDDYLHCYYEFEVYKKDGMFKPKQMLGWVCNLDLGKGTFNITQDPKQAEKYWHDWDCEHNMYYDDYISETLKEIGKATGYIFKCRIDQWYDNMSSYGKRITDAEIQKMKATGNKAKIDAETVVANYIQSELKKQ